MSVIDMHSWALQCQLPHISKQAECHIASSFFTIVLLKHSAWPFCWGVSGEENCCSMPDWCMNAENSFIHNSPPWSKCSQRSHALSKVSAKALNLLLPCPTPGLIQLLRSHHSTTAQLQSLITYSGHSCADNLPLSMTLGLYSIHSLPHLAVCPALMWVLHELDISYTL